MQKHFEGIVGNEIALKRKQERLASELLNIAMVLVFIAAAGFVFEICYGCSLIWQ